MLIAMRKNLFKFLIPVLSLLSVAGYLAFINPLLVRSLNLYEFDRAELGKKANDIAKALLGEDAQFRINESINADRNLLNNLQRSIGLRSESDIVSSKLPVQIYSAVFYLKKESKGLEIGKEEQVLTVKIDSHGRVASLNYIDPDDKDGKPVSASEAGRKIKSLATVLNLDPMSLQQVQPQDIKKEEWIDTGRRANENSDGNKPPAQAEQEFFFSEKIDGVPLATYSHIFKFTRNEVQYSRSLLFKKTVFAEGKAGLIHYASFIIWFAIGFLGLTIFALKVRRDEIDWSHYLRFSSFAAVVTYLYWIFEMGSFSIADILGTLLLAAGIGFPLGLIFAVAESKSRENYSENLAVSDALFSGNFKIKELGELVYFSFVYGGFFFLLPLSAYGFYNIFHKTKLVIATVNPAEISGFLPSSLLLRSFAIPAIYSFLMTAPVFGILACLVCQRFPGKRGSAAVSFVFAVACIPIIENEPVWLWLILMFLASLLLCRIWKKLGFPGVMLAIFIPLCLQRAFLLILAKDMMFAFIGLVLLLFWIFIFALSVYLIFKGKPVSKMKPYEPKYLKRMKEKERFERELEIAKNLQSRLLPKTSPDLKDYEISTLCEPANEVGGDYFDFLTLDDNKMLIFLGDVSGKGIRAAFYMTLAKGLLHGSFALLKDHRELLTLLNRRFGALSEDGVFLTLIALTLDFETREILLSSAGHNPPLLFKNDTVWVVPSRGLVIGPMPDDILLKSLKDFKFKMDEGNVLLLYTDGITEAMNPDLDEYGVDRLKEVFQKCVHLSADEIVNAIRKSVYEFTEGSPQSDDLTILVLKAKNGAS
jgi:hypothetical protein